MEEKNGGKDMKWRSRERERKGEKERQGCEHG